jgi:F-type H+-transporting ATPase subunit b
MMEWSWSTFLIEIVNFTLLIWLLTRLLYRPITNAIAARRRAIAQASEHAEQVLREGEELRKRYEERASEWEREKAGLREQFKRDLAEERSRREAALEADLQRRDERAEAARRARERDDLRRLERSANERAAKFCGRLLTRFASAELESRLIEAMIEDLAALSVEERARLVRSFEGCEEVRITTCYPLAEPCRARLLDALTACLSRSVNGDFRLDETLLAGVRADLGTTMVEATLVDELRWFATESGNDSV